MKKASLVIIATLLLSLAWVASAQAQAPTWWSASAVTGVPHFLADGTVNTQTVETGHGRGVRLKNLFIGAAYVYVPVTADHGTTFRVLGLRAEDNSPGGYVKAELIRQPRNAAAGPAVSLATVTTDDVFVPADGFQFRTALFNPLTLDMSLFSYYIRITLKRDNSQLKVTAYDVSLEP